MFNTLSIKMYSISHMLQDADDFEMRKRERISSFISITHFYK